MSTVIDDRKKGRGDRAPGPRAHASTARRTRGSATADRATRSKAAQRALDRRERRLAPEGAVAAVTRKRVGGIPLVFPVLLLIVGALGLTLYLTTKSAQDSYALDAMRKQNQTLQDKRDNLKRQHDLADSAPALAAKAGELGMVPSDGSVQIVIGADGKARKVGAATASNGKRLPDLNPAPDPVDKIDPKDVDDSEGLNGSDDTESSAGPTTGTTATPAPATPSTPAPPTQTTPTQTTPTQTRTTPAETTQPNGPHPNVRPAPDGRRQVGAPRTNVTPPADATPERNTEPPR
ncbi:hypothetical protein L5G28_13980 [Gordonia sp. HY285]|uniref:hypothetical protein n=1 Tax=Gordonia liuliyuniae TaxID=2911517 RepID=UPI001F2AB337|nr:hypothetical protein [Gordonia liuliyuniae]MCF8611256.1 hypothetical protein [Gordonia liuliyuniae]